MQENYTKIYIVLIFAAAIASMLGTHAFDTDPHAVYVSTRTH